LARPGQTQGQRRRPGVQAHARRGVTVTEREEEQEEQEDDLFIERECVRETHLYYELSIAGGLGRRLRTDSASPYLRDYLTD
jgi:hypothetical protein